MYDDIEDDTCLAGNYVATFIYLFARRGQDIGKSALCMLMDMIFLNICVYLNCLCYLLLCEVKGKQNILPYSIYRNMIRIHLPKCDSSLNKKKASNSFSISWGKVNASCLQELARLCKTVRYSNEFFCNRIQNLLLLFTPFEEFVFSLYELWLLEVSFYQCKIWNILYRLHMFKLGTTITLKGFVINSTSRCGFAKWFFFFTSL